MCTLPLSFPNTSEQYASGSGSTLQLGQERDRHHQTGAAVTITHGVNVSAHTGQRCSRNDADMQGLGQGGEIECILQTHRPIYAPVYIPCHHMCMLCNLMQVIF